MRDLIIYGGGGFGRETALMVAQINSVRPSWRVIGFCDDNLPKGTIVDNIPVMGGLANLNNYAQEVSVTIAVADPQTRMKIRDGIRNPKVDYPALVHPSVMGGDLARNKIGEGSIVTAGNIFTTNIQIHAFVIVNLACTIGHDVVIGDFSSVMPGCSISGAVNIGRAALIGTGARILPGVEIGESCRVGAGAVVTKPVAASETVVGIPAKPLKK